jgi:hypothetical protein
MDFRGSTDAGRTWYSTVIRSRASSAMDSSSAATAATGCPTKTTRSMASTACARVGAFFFSCGMSAAVSTARTPGSALGLRRVDPDDARVGVRAPEELRVQQAAGLEIRHVLDAAGHLLGSVGTGNGEADPLDVARGLHHGHGYLPFPPATVPAASVMAASILV